MDERPVVFTGDVVDAAVDGLLLEGVGLSSTNACVTGGRVGADGLKLVPKGSLHNAHRDTHATHHGKLTDMLETKESEWMVLLNVTSSTCRRRNLAVE